MDGVRCPAETWYEGNRLVGPHWARCTQDAGHDGHHCVMTEFWGVVWPVDAEVES